MKPLLVLHRWFVVVLGVLASAGPARADPGYYLVTPYSQPGQLALDLRYWTVKAPREPATLWPELGLRWGVNSRWTSGLFASFVGDGLHRQKLSSWNWQNEILLTQGQYPFDLALHVQLIRNHGEDNALEWGPVFQTEWGLTQLNANLFFERRWSAGRRTQLKYQWQALHRLRPGWRLGVQGFGELGPWEHWSDRQSHRTGPTLRVALPTADLQLAYLWGKTYRRHGDMFSAQLLWAF
ncbi:MAG TPA: hypothetical protein VJN44_19540 [Roseateles sp.]|nr:hypothetical protein [Roseateles sp.]